VSVDGPTVRVRCRSCGCPLAVVRPEYSPDRHLGLEADTSGPVVRWNVRDDPQTAKPQQRRRNHLDVVSPELRQQSEPVAWPLDSLGATVKVWCDRHGFVSVSTAGLRAQHDEAMRSGRQVVWRVQPLTRAR
jgi:hypothetical protein